jgi:hypothetical protein
MVVRRSERMGEGRREGFGVERRAVIVEESVDERLGSG